MRGLSQTPCGRRAFVRGPTRITAYLTPISGPPNETVLPAAMQRGGLQVATRHGSWRR